MSPGADEALARWWWARARAAASPGAARDLILMNSEIDIRALLPSIRVPTLVLHRSGDHDSRPEEGRYIAERIPGARFVELPGEVHMPWVEADQILDEVEGFLTGVRRSPERDRVLATVLFTDIVGSTERAAALGDRAWLELREAHHLSVRGALGRYRGNEVETAGDSFLATFDGPARAVHLGARIAAEARAGEVLVSSTVKDLVAGSGIVFEDRGAASLKGVPGEWHLYAVAEAPDYKAEEGLHNWANLGRERNSRGVQDGRAGHG